jgi:hypothetical protein
MLPLEEKAVNFAKKYTGSFLICFFTFFMQVTAGTGKAQSRTVSSNLV